MRELSDCKVLLVDDVRANLDVLVQTLKQDCKLSVATSGESALKIVARTPPDLILLDVMLPDLDGYEVCRRLRDSPLTREIPILFLSALDEPLNKQVAFEAGGTDYVTKPFEPVEVRARVRSLLRAKINQDAVRERNAADLRVAQQIQMSLVSKDFSFLEGSTFDAFAALEPARAVGGDLYLLFPLDEGRLCACIGDVSGKGVPAALFMAVAVTLIRSTARLTRQPEEILTRINDELARDNPSSTFLTLVCAVVEIESGRVRLASGGHTAPLLIRPARPPELLLGSPGSVLGILPGISFSSTEFTLEPGSSLLLYTDGVTEAFDPQDRCFGEERLLRTFAASPPTSARSVVLEMLWTVREFSASAAQSDDIALLALHRRPAGMAASAGQAPLDLRLGATASEVVRGCEELRRFYRAEGVAGEAIHDLVLAFEELASNVVRHGYRSNSDGWIGVVAERFPDSARVQISDGAEPFDPRLAPEPDLGAERPGAGGLGIHIARALVEEIEYSRSDLGNQTVITRQLSNMPGHAPEEKQPMALKIDIEGIRDPKGLRISLCGSLDTATAPELSGRLRDDFDDSIDVVIFDLQELEFLSSAGLQVLLTVQKTVKDRDGKVVMLNMQPQIKKVFEIVKAVANFSVFSSKRELDEYLATIQAKHREP